MVRKKKAKTDPTMEQDITDLELLFEESERATPSDHSNLVLQNVMIQAADLYETLAKVSTTHRYINNGTTTIETVYTFPLPANAVLLDMSLSIGDRMMTGQIIPKKTGGRPL